MNVYISVFLSLCNIQNICIRKKIGSLYFYPTNKGKNFTWRIICISYKLESTIDLTAGSPIVCHFQFFVINATHTWSVSIPNMPDHVKERTIDREIDQEQGSTRGIYMRIIRGLVAFHKHNATINIVSPLLKNWSI